MKEIIDFNYMCKRFLVSVYNPFGFGLVYENIRQLNDGW